jgi:hypothetical protein
MADDQVVEAKSGFQAYIAGAPFRVRRGARFWSNDPIVKDNPEQFGDLTVEKSPAMSRQAERAKILSGTSETADATPGRRRARTVPDPGVSKGDPEPQGSDAPVEHRKPPEGADAPEDESAADAAGEKSAPKAPGRAAVKRPAKATDEDPDKDAGRSADVDTGKSKPATSGGKAGSDA